MFRHHVRSKCEIGGTCSKFGRTMSDDRLLFPPLDARQDEFRLSQANFIVNFKTTML